METIAQDDGLLRLKEVVDTIREDTFRAAWESVRVRYHLPEVAIIDAPCYLDAERIVDERTKMVRCGATDGEQFWLHAPGLRAREDMGANFPLLVLNTWIHERVHMLPVRIPSQRTRRVVFGKQVWFTLYRSGFHKVLTFELPSGFKGRYGGGDCFFFLNEGVTELLAREILWEYLERHRDFCEQTEDRVTLYKLLLDASANWSLYPKPTSLVRSFVSRLAMHEAEDGLWCSVYDANIQSIDLLEDPQWTQRFDRAKIREFVEELSGANLNELGMLEMCFLIPEPEAK